MFKIGKSIDTESLSVVFVEKRGEYCDYETYSKVRALAGALW